MSAGRTILNSATFNRLIDRMNFNNHKLKVINDNVIESLHHTSKQFEKEIFFNTPAIQKIDMAVTNKMHIEVPRQHRYTEIEKQGPIDANEQLAAGQGTYMNQQEVMSVYKKWVNLFNDVLKV